jgi:hypothetical protein
VTNSDEMRIAARLRREHRDWTWSEIVTAAKVEAARTDLKRRRFIEQLRGGR